MPSVKADIPDRQPSANSRLMRRSKGVLGLLPTPAIGSCSGAQSRENAWATHALRSSATKMGADICIQTESSGRTYERPALRKAFAAFAADTKVA
jgi:hypothetical protein